VIEYLIEVVLSHIKQNSYYPVDIKGKNMKKVSCLRLILLICGISLAVGENLKQNNGISMASNDSTTKKEEGCSAAAGSDQCSRSDARKLSRKKRTVTLPNSSALMLQSRLFIPQLPIGFYLVWIRVRFFIRAMFTDATISTPGQNPLLAALARRKRALGSSDDEDIEDIDEENNPHIANILTRTVADDQLEILKKLEASLDKSGLPGHQCILRSICEIKETPIHEWSLVGEMITNFILPKKDNLTALDEYRKAETIGEEQGDCWSFYPQCPFSIFNIIPDVYTKDDQVKVTFDDFSAGSGTTMDHPDDESQKDEENTTIDGVDGNVFEDNSDEKLEKLLKEFGASHDDVKEVKFDLDLTKP